MSGRREGSDKKWHDGLRGKPSGENKTLNMRSQKAVIGPKHLMTVATTLRTKLTQTFVGQFCGEITETHIYIRIYTVLAKEDTAS